MVAINKSRLDFACMFKQKKTTYYDDFYVVEGNAGKFHVIDLTCLLAS